jgi:Domain of unknown function (DUF5655)
MAMPDGDAMRPMWHCPECGKPFANRNSSHSCVRIPLDAHFTDRARARELFDAFLAAVNETGVEPVDVIVSKGRIELMTRARFAGAVVHRDYIRIGFWLKRGFETDRFRVEVYPPKDWVYRLDLRDEAQIDDELRSLLRESRIVGDQRHPSQARYRVRGRISPADAPAG